MKDKVLFIFTSILFISWMLMPVRVMSRIEPMPDSCYNTYLGYDYYHRTDTCSFYEVNWSEHYTVLATKYNPVKSQCDDDPLITADNSKINMDKLNRHDLKWIAVSRDLLKHFSYGDKVYIECDNPRLTGVWTIHDTMNARWTKRIDLLVPNNDQYQFDRPMNIKLRKVKYYD